MAIFKRKNSDKATTLDDEIAVLKSALAQYPPGYALRLGERCMCPQCGALSIVMVGNESTTVTVHRCGSCDRSWTITKRALDAVAAAAAQGTDELESAKRRLAKDHPLQVLVVEDDPADAKLLKAILAPALDDIMQIFHAETLHEGLASTKLGFDAALVDLNLPDSRGMATVKAFQKGAPGVPVYFFTGDAEAAVDLRSANVPVLAKQAWLDLLQAHHQGTADLLNLLADTVVAAPAGPGARPAPGAS